MSPSEIFGIAVVIVGLIAWFVRLEQETKHNKEDIAAVIVAYDLKIKEMKDAHEKEQGILWGKLDGVQTTMNQILISFGRMEGKLDRK